MRVFHKRAPPKAPFRFSHKPGGVLLLAGERLTILRFRDKRNGGATGTPCQRRLQLPPELGPFHFEVLGRCASRHARRPLHVPALGFVPIEVRPEIATRAARLTGCRASSRIRFFFRRAHDELARSRSARRTALAIPAARVPDLRSARAAQAPRSPKCRETILRPC